MAKILIIDDDLALRNGLAARLKANGFTTAFAADGAAAVQVARREQPDLILLDLGLPGGDGFLVLSRLRQLVTVACIPVVVITARPAEGNRERALDAGARAFLQKPIESEELLATINQILGSTV